jgi:hypothetical protein
LRETKRGRQPAGAGTDDQDIDFKRFALAH